MNRQAGIHIGHGHTWCNADLLPPAGGRGVRFPLTVTAADL